MRRRRCKVLEECLRECVLILSDANRVNETLRSAYSAAETMPACPPLAPTMRAAASRGVKWFDLTKISIVGVAVLRQINHRLGRRRSFDDGDESRRRRDAAGTGLGAVHVIDVGEIGSLRAVDNLDTDCRERRIIGETDIELRLPGRRRDLNRCLTDRDAWSRRWSQFAAGKDAGHNQWNRRSKDLETQHDTPLAEPGPVDTQGLWLAECKENSLPRS